jgi:hypothetical protein
LLGRCQANGRHGWRSPEEIGGPDLLATVLEALVVAWAFAVRSPSVSSRAASPRSGMFTTALLWTGVVVMTAVVFSSTTGEAAH